MAFDRAAAERRRRVAAPSTTLAWPCNELGLLPCRIRRAEEPEQRKPRPKGCATSDRSGFRWVTSHTFRKRVATRMDEAGLSARAIAEHLGHSNPSMTQDVYMGRGVAVAEAATVLGRAS